MNGRWQPGQRTLSDRGFAPWKLLAIAAVLLIAYFVLRRVLRSDEERVSEAIEEARTALVDGRDAEFLAFFAPDVRYQKTGGLADVKRDLARFRETGIRQVEATKKQIRVDHGDADVRFDAVVLAGLQAVAQKTVHVHAAQRDGGWRVISLTWE